ncbi:AraC family transcriptional regulator [Paenibacillus sp. VCA1]|uniref:AraC family transcriptional regulator n=1 Tax=Paenibacillus sp. VCA1 TaxID=3039148 RepID=UPI002871ECB9|nr:AraC family transcriptional regulator [Paenibacillus sp. VCA1]MDR9857369.1 AraC family transcriptional regulator [Paenibacillus sp. VCA1]
MDISVSQTKLLTYQYELVSMICKHALSDGTHHTSIPSLRLIRQSHVSEPVHTVYEPSLCIIAQGSKIALLAKESYQYDETSYLVASVHLPITGQIMKATSEKPYLCVQITFQLDEILDTIKTSHQTWNGNSNARRGIFVKKSNPQFLNAVLRLVELLDTPEDIPALAPLVVREILYRVLQGEQGDLIKQFAMLGSHANRISRVIHLIHRDFSKPLSIEDLAKDANMSPSSLHSHFKKVTAMSPLQYQKILRLQEARRLLLSETSEAADAGFQVGYESPSQFNREYARMFGLPPIRDMKRVRDYLTGAN